jgi:glycosyltransferase involved in cell wall biosynthesis
MTNPFFSILLPTRDRPQFVRMVLLSLAKQTYKNFEVILSDNYLSSSCYEAYEEFKDKINIYYIHPQNPLSMADNYQYALSFSIGHYIIALEDKLALFPSSLLRLKRIIDRKKYEIFNFTFDSYFPKLDDLYSGEWSPSYGIYFDRIFNAFSFLKKRIQFKIPYKNQNSKDHTRNKVMFGCWSRKLVDRIQKDSNVFCPSCPDYTSMVLGSIYTISNAYDIGRPLGVLVVNNNYSIGAMSTISIHAAKSFQQTSDIEGKRKKHSPFEGCFFIQCVVLATDFTAMIDACGLSRKLKVNKKNLAIRALEELEQFKDISIEEKIHCQSMIPKPSFFTLLKDKIYNYIYSNFNPFSVFLYLKVNILGRLGIKKYQLLLLHRSFCRSYQAESIAFEKVLEMANDHYKKLF